MISFITSRFGRRAVLATLGVALMTLFMAAASTAQAATPAEGTPNIPDGGAAGYYVWHNADGYHLRTHGPGQEHDFVARLHTDGVFTDVDTVRLESRDGVQVEDGGHTLVFHAHTFDGTDGVNFRVQGPGDDIRVGLHLDGQLIGTDSIFIGQMGIHPDSNPFKIDR